jgi:hypothetical protein
MDINIIGGVIRAVAPALIAYLAGKGILPAADYSGVIAAVIALIAAGWSVKTNKPAAV